MNDLETLYVYRSLSWETAAAIREWANAQGIMSTLEGWDMHVTLMYSKSPVFWSQGKADREVLTINGGQRSVELFGEGDKKCVVLVIESEALQERHKELIAVGAVYSHDVYKPHITITYKGKGVDVSQIVPYDGAIELGCEWWQPVTGNPYGKRDLMAKQADDFQSFGKAQVVKVNGRLGVVFGYAIVSKINGEEYYDHHGDHIPEDAMLKASVNFMKSYRVSGDMHERDGDGNPVKDGDVVFAFPMTKEIAESLNITVEKTGLLVAIQPSASVLKKFESGEYTGFSIGGRRIIDEEVV
jgi:hypothetical protein